MEDDACKTLLRFYMRERKSMQFFSKWKEKSRILTCSDLFECSMHAGSWALEEGRFISKSFWAVASLIPCGQLPCAPKFNEDWEEENFLERGVKKTAMLQLDWNEQHNAFIWGTWSRKSSNVGNQEATEADGNPGRWIAQGICQSAKHKFVIHYVHTKKSLRWFHLTHHSENQWSLHLGSWSTPMFKDS